MPREDEDLERISRDVDAFLGAHGDRASECLDGLPAVGESGLSARSFDVAELVAGRYRLDEEIGRGAQGVVYRATDVQLRRPVALKALHPFLGGAAATHRLRFEREAHAASRLDHAALCPVYDFGEHAGLPFIVMKLASGTSLSRAVADDGAASPGDMERLAGMFEALARGLDRAHAGGVVHRDVKPGNIVVEATGAAMLLDFGCAREADDGGGLSLSGDFLGTIAYMAPERIDGTGPVDDRRADVYSLGLSLHECLTGRRVFDAHSREATVKAILASDVPSARSVNRGVPRDLDVVVRTACANDPSRRYASAGAFADDLRRFLDGRPIVARPIGPLTRMLKWARRNPLLASAATLIAAALIVVLVLWAEAARQRRRADTATDGLVVAALRGAVDSLWPARERTVPAMDAWLAAAGPHAARLADEIAVVRARRALATSARHRSLEVAAEAWRACLDELGDATIDLTPTVGLVPLGADPRSGLQEFLHLDTHVGAIPRRRADGRLPFDADTGIVVVLIPGGATFAGAQRDDRLEELTHDPAARDYEHLFRTRLRPYFISKYEVSAAQWRRVMGDEPNRYPLRVAVPDERARGVHPVEMVSWDEATEFLRRIDLRLPTEIEWEHAARAGGPTIWWRGLTVDDIGKRVNIADASAWDAEARWTATRPRFDDGHHLHAPVDALEPNGFGLHHVVGNVWEWCAEWSTAYRQGPPDPLLTAAARRLRPLRGGSFEDDLRVTRIAAREHHVARYRTHSVGFRPALSLEVDR